MRITKLLSLDSAPAQAIVDRAKAISLTMAQRVTPPESFSVGSDMVENGLGQVRPLEVGDILVDEKGGFYKIEAAAEDIYKVTGDIALMQDNLRIAAKGGDGDNIGDPGLGFPSLPASSRRCGAPYSSS